MAANDHLSPQFNYPFIDDVEPEGEHAIRASIKDKDIGSLIWHAKSGEITHLHVDQPFRRRGVATGMWNAAHKEADERGITYPEHSRRRSTEGDRWARFVGGHLPPLDEEWGQE